MVAAEYVVAGTAGHVPHKLDLLQGLLSSDLDGYVAHMKEQVHGYGGEVLSSAHVVAGDVREAVGGLGTEDEGGAVGVAGETREAGNADVG